MSGRPGPVFVVRRNLLLLFIIRAQPADDPVPGNSGYPVPGGTGPGRKNGSGCQKSLKIEFLNMCR